jgi:hypothetical protein
MLPSDFDEDEWWEAVHAILDEIACGRRMATRRADRRARHPPPLRR